MKRRDLLLIGLAVPLAACLPGQKQHAAGSALEKMSEANARAAGAGRALFVVFHATWCPYCKHLLRFLKDKQAAAILGKYYEVLLLNVEEGKRGDPSLEYADAAEALKQVGGGPDSGVPFFAILGVDGTVRANSLGANGNIGTPGAPEEIAHFQSMLRATAPAMTDHEVNALLARLEATRQAKAS